MAHGAIIYYYRFPCQAPFFQGQLLKINRGREYPSFQMCLMPFTSTIERGIEVTLIFIHKDKNALEGNFFHIVEIVIKCLQLFAPHLKGTVERKNLTQLHVQDFFLCRLLTHARNDIGTNFSSLYLNGFPRPTCYVASSIIGMCFKVLTT